ncbi:hypothetical protein [Ornithinibacillus halotolerans]|uniref:Uncharacterized protein n=1 Tax=Ornithinibacillus halotolerans TaxID=1274357 RepID=A0A916S4M6_9BACI|nr:hypothetical protein [Ornithinibacillus halotolerans]GGA80475.1 hypothetical protein GCM10008025_24850 [Ornithinibacillus halotolerans]
MEESVKALKREMSSELIQLQLEQKAFKRRVSTTANLFVPGIGFILYNGSILKGLITLLLFVLYNFIYFNNEVYSMGDWFLTFVFYVPAIAIWLVSTIMVASLDD